MRRLLAFSWWGIVLVLLFAGCQRQPTPVVVTTPTPTFASPAQIQTPPGATEETQATVTPRPSIAMVMPKPPGSLYERRLLTVEWPRKMRQGDGDWVRLYIEADETGRITPTVSAGGHVIGGQPIHIPNLYETHILSVEAVLQIAGLHVSPAEPVMKRLFPGQPVDMYWTLRADDMGTYRGILQVDLLLMPRESNDISRHPLATHHLEIQVVNFLGLSAFWVRLLGGVSTLVGLILSIPDLLEVWRALRDAVKGTEA